MTNADLAAAAGAAVITGAGSGLGRALALQAAARGQPLALADANAPALDAVVATIATRVPVLARTIDVRDAAQMQSFADSAFERYPHIDHLFVNAGILRRTPFDALVLKDAFDIIDVNLKGCLTTLAAFVERMRRQRKPSRIVFIGSQASLLAANGIGVYAATKHAIWALAETLQLELRELGSAAQVSIVIPGAVRTNIVDRSAPGGGAASGPPPQTVLEPEVAAARIFAALDAGACWIHTHEGFLPLVADRFRAVLEETQPPAFRGWSRE